MSAGNITYHSYEPVKSKRRCRVVCAVVKWRDLFMFPGSVAL